MGIDSYRTNLIKKFIKDIEKYDIPDKFKMYNGVDLYAVAREEIDMFNSGRLTSDDIFLDPDSVLRNVMLMWSIDKKKMRKHGTR